MTNLSIDRVLTRCYRAVGRGRLDKTTIRSLFDLTRREEGRGGMITALGGLGDAIVSATATFLCDSGVQFESGPI